MVILAHYKPTATWLAQYKAALAAVTAVQAKVTSDLVPPKAHPLTQIVSSMTEATNPPTFDHPVAVTLGPIVNRATPVDPGDTVAWKPGYRPISITFTVTNQSNVEMVSDANGDATVIGSNGQVYNTAMDTVTDCTSFSNGVYSLEPNQTAWLRCIRPAAEHPHRQGSVVGRP